MVHGSSEGSDHESHRITSSIPSPPTETQTSPLIISSQKRGRDHNKGPQKKARQTEDQRRERNKTMEAERRKRHKSENEAIKTLLGDPIERPCTPVCNAEFTASSGTEQAELLEYLRMLEACSRAPIYDDILRLQLRKMWGSQTSQVSKFSIIEPLAKAIANGVYSNDPDIRVVETSEDLGKSLERGLDRPIFVPAGSQLSNEMVERCKLNRDVASAQDFFSYILHDGTQKMDVQDTGVKSGTSMTREVFVEEVKNRYYFPETRSAPWNGLEIGDRAGTFKGPIEIEKRNVLNQLRFMPSDSVGRPTIGKGMHKRLDSWYLWTEEDSVSRQHGDVVGLGTFIWVLEGLKIWYFQPQRKESDRLLWREQGEEGPKSYEDGWVKKPLQKNDIFIMPGGIPHAVWSPQDTLAVGGHFCLRMSEIIRGLLRDEEHPELTNDEVPEDIFGIISDYLNRVLNNQLAVDEAELNIIWLELQQYTKRKSVPAGPQRTEKRKAHLDRRKSFLAKVKSENWLKLLQRRLCLD
ncbi:MAG: hypothetical protein M1840_006727 [Geoglossum simile]|nr:MAG: hypothetical protein M1840_006727 [Geoglossum simile]